MAILIFNNLPESKSKTQTHVLTAPNIVSINNITVNTGNVSVTKIEGDKVTIECSSGSYSRRVQTGGSYTPSDSKTATDIRSKSTTETYSCTFYEFYGTKLWTAGSLPSSVGGSSYPSSISYSSGGYTGTLYKGSLSINRPKEFTSCSTVGSTTSATVSTTMSYSGTVNKPSSDTRTYAYYYEYEVTIDYVDNSVPSLTLYLADNQPIAENQIIQHYDKTDFLFKINATDSDVGDTLQYSIWLRNVEYQTWTSTENGVETEVDIPYADMLLGNNSVEVKVRDNNGGESSMVFVLRNLTPESYSQKHVFDLINAIGGGAIGQGSLQEIKPSNYSKSTTISLAELVNHLT